MLAEAISTYVPFILKRGMKQAYLFSQDLSLRDIGDPAGCGHDDLTIEYQLQQEHELL